MSDLAHFLTTFSPDFSKPENAPKPVDFPSAPKATKESIELGKKLYEETGCLKCHGTLGRGDGPCGDAVAIDPAVDLVKDATGSRDTLAAELHAYVDIALGEEMTPFRRELRERHRVPCRAPG